MSIDPTPRFADNPFVRIGDSKRSWARLSPIILVSATLLAYSNSFNGAVVFDDRVTLEDSPNIRSLRPIWRAMWANPNTAAGGRPLVSFSLAANYAISGERTWSYHIFNFAVHAAAALTLMGVVRRTLCGPALSHDYGDQAALLALAIALIWAVHPLATESVTYITTRTESMVGLCYLLTVYAAIRANGPNRTGLWTAVAIAACLCGAASKENIASAPLFVVLYDRVLLYDSWAGAWRARRRLFIGLAASWLVLAALLATGSSLRLKGFGTAEVTWIRYALTQFGVIVHYLKLSLWPHPIIVDYFAWPVARSLVQVWPQALVVIGLVLGTAWALRRRKPVGLLGAWFFLILAPSSSVIPLSTELVAERRMYLPLAAVITLLVCGLYRAARMLSATAATRMTAGVALIVAIVFGVLTHQQNRVYATEIAFWQDQIAKWPGNPRAHNALGKSYDVVGQRELAIECFDRCLRMKPDFALAWYNRGTVRRQQGRYRDALDDLRCAAELQPGMPQFHFAIGQAYLDAGEPETAESAFRAALRCRPGYPGANFRLGLISAQAGRLAESAAYFQAELGVSPDDANTRGNLAAVLQALGRTSEALLHYEAALRQRPDDFVLLDRYAEALATTGQFFRAEGVALQAIERARASKHDDLQREWEQRLERYRQSRK